MARNILIDIDTVMLYFTHIFYFNAYGILTCYIFYADAMIMSCFLHKN